MKTGFFKNPAKCIYGSNSFPGGGRGVLKEDLNRLCEGTGRNCQAQDGSNFFSEGDNGILNTDLYRWCEAKCGKNCRTYLTDCKMTEQITVMRQAYIRSGNHVL